MAYELNNFATSLPINLLIAEREGLARSDAIRVGALASLVARMPMSIFMAQLLARREVPAEEAPAPTGVLVPDVTLQTEDDATAQLKGLGFSVATTKESSDVVRPGIVIGQDPVPKTRVRAGSTVTLTISGETEVEVPDVTLQEKDAATKQLTGLEFEVGTKEQSSNAIQQGFVISQEPAANTSAPAKSTVTLTISSGAAAEPG
jgi:eukaryotic-like serine/threonine-protein kinase